MNQTRSYLLEALEWSEDRLFWYSFDTAEHYLTDIEQLKSGDAKIIMAQPDFWHWWNALLDNTIELFLIRMNIHSQNLESDFKSAVLAWLNGQNIHRSFWDSNYERMISKLIKNQTTSHVS